MKRAPSMLAVLLAFEKWEGNFIMCNECWATEDGMPRFTEEIYDEWLELQAMRNEALAAEKKRAGKV